VASIQDFLFRILADSSQFRREMQEDAAAAEELKKAASGDATLDVKADTEEADLKIDELKGKLLEPKTLKVVADAAKAEADLEAFKALLDTIPPDKKVRINVEKRTIEYGDVPKEGEGGGGKKDFGGGGGGLLGATIMTFLPTLTPLLATATAGAMGLVSALGAATAGIGGLAAVATPAIKQVISDVNSGKGAIDKLTGSEKQAALQLQEFEGFWKSYSASFNQPVMNGFTAALKMAQQLLIDLKPAITGAAQALTVLMNDAQKALASPFWKSFFDYLGGTAKNSIIQLGQIAGNVLKTIAGLMMAFQPLSNSMLQGLVKITAAWANWAANLSKTQGFKDFLNYVRQNGPLVMQLLGQAAQLVGRFLVAMAPLGHIILQVAVSVLTFVNNLTKAHPELLQLVGLIISGIGAFKLISAAVSGAISAFNGLMTAFKYVRIAMLALMEGNPIGWIITIGVAVVALATLIVTHWTQIKNFLLGVWKAVKADAEAAWKAITSTLSSVWNGIKTAATAAWNGIKDFFVAWWNILKTVFYTAILALYLLLTGQWGKIGELFRAAGAKIHSIMSSFWTQLKSLFGSAVSSLISTIERWFNNTVRWFERLPGRVGAAVRSMWSAIHSAFSSGISAAESAISHLISSIGSFFASLPGRALQWGRNMVSGFISGITSMVGAVGNAVHGLIQRAAAFIGFHSPSKEGEGQHIVEWGTNMVKGFIDGINLALPQLHDTMAKVIAPPSTLQFANNVHSMITGNTATPQPTTASQQPTQHVVNIHNNVPAIGQVVVRNDQDIQKIQRALYNSNQNVIRALGQILPQRG
jgi:phage-related protein